jgi:hypothetical protein
MSSPTRWKPVYVNGAPVPPPTNQITNSQVCDDCPGRWHRICRHDRICWKRENADIRAERGPSYTHPLPTDQTSHETQKQAVGGSLLTP